MTESGICCLQVDDAELEDLFVAPGQIRTVKRSKVTCTLRMTQDGRQDRRVVLGLATNWACMLTTNLRNAPEMAKLVSL